jgi:hypothetical protein
MTNQNAKAQFEAPVRLLAVQLRQASQGLVGGLARAVAGLHDLEMSHYEMTKKKSLQ